MSAHNRWSFAMESTRYCNYSKDRFGGELKFIVPSWLDENPNEPKLLEDPQYLKATKLFADLFDLTNFTYDQLVRNYGWKAQQAAIILPSDLKTEIAVTGFEHDWSHIFNQRVYGLTGAPHPQMKEVMEPVWKEFVKRNYLVYESAS